MSYRNTYITDFLYKHGMDTELEAIRQKLDSFGSVHWEGERGMGYFHGVIKGLYYDEVERQEEEIANALKEMGVKIKIVHETTKEDLVSTPTPLKEVAKE